MLSVGARLPTLGIIGGIAPESTIAYYRQIVSAYLLRVPDNYPQILINSINMRQMLNLVEEQHFDGLVDFLLTELEKLAQAGVDFALLASNTPHLVFTQLEQNSPLPLISIVEATATQASKLGVKCVGLCGTKFTMQGGFYDKVFSRRSIQVIQPGVVEQECIHSIYMNELVKGIFRESSRRELVDIVQALRKRHSIEALVLGGTELPLLLYPEEEAAIPFLDTTAIHVQAALSKLME